jgi:DNA-binding transcriptional LysR family regulator
MIPSPADLTYFLEASETLNVSRAAERLGVTQPTLSQALKRVEACIGQDVFVRSKKGLALTPAGRVLARQSLELMELWSRIQSGAVDVTTQVKGRVTIGCHPSVALYTLSLFLPDALRLHPELNIKLVHDLSRSITEGVISSAIDLGIVVNPVRHSDLMITKLTDDNVTLWRARSLPLGRGAEISSEIPLIMDPSLSQAQRILKKYQKSGAPARRVVESSNLEVIADLVSASAGVGILPTRVAEKAGRELIPVHGAPSVKDEICVIARVESRRIAAIRYLTESLRKGFKT